MALIPENIDIKNPEFEYRNKDVMGLELAVQLGKNTGKSTKSTLTFRTSSIKGYDYKNKEHLWSGPYPMGEISIQFTGEYERDVLIAAFQKIGLLSSLTYGKIAHGPFEPHEEEENGIREQTPSV